MSTLGHYFICVRLKNLADGCRRTRGGLFLGCGSRNTIVVPNSAHHFETKRSSVAIEFPRWEAGK
jgi:hypothetical protein